MSKESRILPLKDKQVWTDDEFEYIYGEMDSFISLGEFKYHALNYCKDYVEPGYKVINIDNLKEITYQPEDGDILFLYQGEIIVKEKLFKLIRG